MKENPYEDGYTTGASFAEYHFGMWQDAEDPPLPWPRAAWDVHMFVEDCLPRMRLAFGARIAQDLRAAGFDPEYLPMPRALIEGVDAGYRARLTELLNEFVKRCGMRGY